MADEPRGCLVNLLGGFLRPQESSDSRSEMPDIMVSKKFMSPAETNFYCVLQTVVAGRGVIFAQVSLGQLFFVPGSDKTNPGRTTWNNKIARRAVDFVVCDEKTMRPLVAIELDDATHANAKREQRDDEMELIFKAAGLPFLHVLASREYDTRELAATIGPHLQTA